MTNPEPKVSEKARQSDKVRQLTFNILISQQQDPPMLFDNVADIVQSSLSELLEAGRLASDRLWSAGENQIARQLDAIFSKWEPK